jgi:hypothetical protein
MIQDRPDELDYVAEGAGIGVGVQFITKRGTLAVGGGEVLLLDEHDAVIDRASARSTRASKPRYALGTTVRVDMNGEAYKVTPEFAPYIFPGTTRFRRARSAVDGFIAALESANGRA